MEWNDVNYTLISVTSSWTLSY